MHEKKSAIEAKIQRLKEELAEIDRKAAERLGFLCLKAGLADVEIEPSQLEEELRKIAARFPKKSNGEKQEGAAPNSARGSRRAAKDHPEDSRVGEANG